MSKIWRWIAPAALAGGLLATAAVPAQAASPAAPSVTISATSPHYPGAVKGLVDHYALVIYKDASGSMNTATISGDVTGAASGDAATLLAEPFGKKTFTSTGQSTTLSPSGSTPVAYSFTVTPTLATKYEVQVTGSTPDTTSGTATVYVTEWPGGTKWTTKCSNGDCTFSFQYYEELPVSAYRTETAKHFYFYFDLDPKLSAKSFPKYLYLDKAASVSKAHKFNKDEFWVLVKWSVRTSLKNPARFGLAELCTKDTLTKDGLGLPGHHGCGAKRVSTSAPYVG